MQDIAISINKIECVPFSKLFHQLEHILWIFIFSFFFSPTYLLNTLFLFYEFSSQAKMSDMPWAVTDLSFKDELFQLQPKVDYK